MEAEDEGFLEEQAAEGKTKSRKERKQRTQPLALLTEATTKVIVSVHFNQRDWHVHKNIIQEIGNLSDAGDTGDTHLT